MVDISSKIHRHFSFLFLSMFLRLPLFPRAAIIIQFETCCRIRHITTFDSLFNRHSPNHHLFNIVSCFCCSTVLAHIHRIFNDIIRQVISHFIRVFIHDCGIHTAIISSILLSLLVSGCDENNYWFIHNRYLLIICNLCIMSCWCILNYCSCSFIHFEQ